MPARKKYRKRGSAFVTAVQLNLDTEGFTYQKWGGIQVCKRGDWIVDNDGDTYTIARDSFSQTYEKLGPGLYFKPGFVWAERTDESGVIETKEGKTAYEVGDYIVYNEEDGTDGYAMSPDKFESMYELA